jgi:hypothetical protein
MSNNVGYLNTSIKPVANGSSYSRKIHLIRVQKHWFLSACDDLSAQYCTKYFCCESLAGMTSAWVLASDVIIIFKEILSGISRLKKKQAKAAGHIRIVFLGGYDSKNSANNTAVCYTPTLGYCSRSSEIFKFCLVSTSRIISSTVCALSALCIGKLGGPT